MRRNNRIFDVEGGGGERIPQDGGEGCAAVKLGGGGVQIVQNIYKYSCPSRYGSC
jgi:hypothetical protein